jgi:hypothetical protein
VTNLIKRLHIYAGLLSFTILLLFGIVGMTGAFLPAPAQRQQPPFMGREVAFAIPQAAGDRELAEAVWKKVAPPRTGPPPEFAIRRDPSHNLVFQVFSPNGPIRITVLEKESRVRIETRRNRWWQYFGTLHETSIQSTIPDLPVRLWTWYNEFSIWTLIFLALSGIWLWLASRPGWRWGRMAFGLGTALFAVVWVTLR